LQESVPGEIVTPHAEPTNILLIIADDVGVDNVRCYGRCPRAPPTPHLDQLAASGVLFRNVWSTPACSPTRAGIHTGRHGFRTGVGTVILPVFDNVLRESEVTLPEILSRAGYGTALIGKWHLGNHHNGGADGPWLVGGWSYHAGTMRQALDIRRNYYKYSHVVNGEKQKVRSYATIRTVDDALCWIRVQNRPWFCCVSFNAAHKPFHRPPRHLHSYDLAGPPPKLDPHSHYRAAVEAMDREIGRLLASLGDELSRTTVIFVGDNGTPGEVVYPPRDPKKAKFSVYQAGIHVPLIIAGPGVVAAGREVGGLVHTLDIFSTVCHLARVDPRSCLPPGRRLDSVSLMPYLLHPGQPSLRSTLYTELFNFDDVEKGAAAVRNGRYKLIREKGKSDRYHLYDLLEDPHEKHDLLTCGCLDEEDRLNYRFLAGELRRVRRSR